MQQAEKSACKLAVGIERDAPDDVAHGHADEECGGGTAGAESAVPPAAPPSPGFLAAELDRHRPEDQREEQQHERQIEARKHRRINRRKRGEQGPAAGHQPDLVAIPHRADGIVEHAPLVIVLDAQHQGSHAEIEAI